MSKVIDLAPEFPGAVWHSDGSGTAITDANGTIRAEGGGQKNRYRMLSTVDILKDFTLQVEVRLPADFASWNATSVEIDFRTKSTDSDDQALDVSVCRNTNSANFTSTDNVSTTAEQWAVLSLTDGEMTYNSTSWYNTDTLLLKLKPKSKNSNYVEIGRIRIRHNT